ncbi:MAG: DUF6614 family protein [Pseudomonadota bacterium]
MPGPEVTLHSLFDLRPGCTESGFKAVYDAFAAHLRDEGFVVTWRTLRRLPHAGYDTDPPASQFAADLVFTDRPAMLSAWDHVEADGPGVQRVHRAVNRQVCNARFYLTETVD